MRNPPPLAALKWPLARIAAVLLLAGTGMLWSRQQADTARQALLAAQGALDNARQTLVRSRDEKQLIATHLADYRALAARGFVGPESRLAWIEAVQLANRDAGLYGLEYRLAPRAPARAELAHGVPLGHTLMTLDLPLLVETDLSHFLDALRARAPGVVRVRGCRLSQAGAPAFDLPVRPTLRAECELLWFTVARGADAS